MQVVKIHEKIGTPTPEVLAKLKKHSNSHIDFNFAKKEPQKMKDLLPPICNADCVDVITRLLAYDADDRLSARQAVKHPYFKELRAAEHKEKAAAAGGDGAEAVSDERTHAPAGATTRKGRHERFSNQNERGGGHGESSNSILPSITGGGGGMPARKAKVSSCHPSRMLRTPRVESAEITCNMCMPPRSAEISAGSPPRDQCDTGLVIPLTWRRRRRRRRQRASVRRARERQQRGRLFGRLRGALRL